MSITGILNSEAGLTLVSAVVGGAWTVFRSSEWYRRRTERRYHKAIEALEAAVEQTYRSYVRAIKASRSDGKLTPEEMRRARQLARETAIAFGRSQGVDVLRELGAEYIDLWIARLVRRLKSPGA